VQDRREHWKQSQPKLAPPVFGSARIKKTPAGRPRLSRPIMPGRVTGHLFGVAHEHDCDARATDKILDAFD
jgi:hypothetical protein